MAGVSNYWCFTCNNYTDDDIHMFQTMDYEYLIYGHEVGENGTPHLQGYVRFNSSKRISAMKKYHPTCHWEKARGSFEQNVAYCSKEDYDPFVDGIPPEKRGQSGGIATKRLYEEAFNLAKKGKMSDIPQPLLTRHYVTYKLVGKDYPRPDLVALPTLDNEWYYGASGTGKSLKAYTDNPGAYRKMCNKWWDGYQDEDVVIIDDFDRAHSHLCHHLKLWGDHYPFLAETKGSCKLVRPKKIIVTSNYSIEDIWGFDSASRDPIMRRFKEIKF